MSSEKWRQQRLKLSLFTYLGKIKWLLVRWELTDWDFLQVISSQVEWLEGGQIADLDGQVGDLVAAGVQLHEVLHLANLLRKANQAVVVHDEALEGGQLTDWRGKVAQLVPAENWKRRNINIKRRGLDLRKLVQRWEK